MLLGFVFIAIGMWIYMSAEQCCGPRDTLLGGPVGIGTLISTFGAGLVMQIVYSIIRFEPRDLKHKEPFLKK